MIDPAPFWASLFLYFFESKHVQNLIFKKSTNNYHVPNRFKDDLRTKSFKCIYPGEVELKLDLVEHATFLGLDIKIGDEIFLCKLFDKRDKFSFFIVSMPHFESNIPSAIFHGSIFSEFHRIARCTMKLEHFPLRTSELYSRMLS